MRQSEKKKKYLIIKRIIDVIVSAVALVILFPFMLLIALIIVIDDPGASPFFTQKRVGKDGKEFTFYKFRTMYSDAGEKQADLLPLNEMDGPVFKIKHDPRITRVGVFLRRTSIDEIPQFLNVLKGEMSIVGPRPALPEEVACYNEREKIRLLVTPGLTCYWQVQPHRNELSFKEWVELDIKYIKERSLKVDFKIIVNTFGAVIGLNGV
ncbi:MAG: sugar transferase [Oscillospiraceae bacterium]|nr:sugar transferase [Oscillospiraceae bacterium]